MKLLRTLLAPDFTPLEVALSSFESHAAARLLKSDQPLFVRTSTAMRWLEEGNNGYPVEPGYISEWCSNPFVSTWLGVRTCSTRTAHR